LLESKTPEPTFGPRIKRQRGDGPVFTISIVPDFHPNEWIYWPRLSFTGPGGLSIVPGSNLINKTRAASTVTSSDALGKYIFTAVQGVSQRHSSYDTSYSLQGNSDFAFVFRRGNE